VTVLVTGGSGVVGREVTRLLVEEGRNVRAMARSPEAAGTVSALGAEPVPGDILEYPDLVVAMRDVDVVYHIAGMNSMCLRSIEPMRSINVDGTRNVIRAAAAAGARRVVYTSSAVTIGEAKGTIGSEASPHRGFFLSKYERTKFEAERVALGEQLDVEVVAVNPSSVQGPGRASGTGRLLLAVASGRLPFLIDTTVSMVDITDTARGHLLAEINGKPGERYILSGFSMHTRDAAHVLAELTGVRVRVIPVPSTALVAIGRVVEAATCRPRFCAEMARVLAFGHTYDGSRATRDLGITYTPSEVTLARTITWFRENGYLEP
jgi:dihydroflavonol-4-reductase